MNRTNQSTVIKEAINSLLDGGITDKQEIYSQVVDNLGVPRPTVRRVAGDLRKELLIKIKILQSETQSTISSTIRNTPSVTDSTWSDDSRKALIKKTRRKKILDNHPDRGGSDEALKKVLDANN